MFLLLVRKNKVVQIQWQQTIMEMQKKMTGSCLFTIVGGTWTTQSIAYNGTMTVSMMGIPVLDSTIN